MTEPTPKQKLERNVAVIMGIGQGQSAPPKTRYSSATDISDWIVRSLGFDRDHELETGSIVEKFLRKALDTADQYASDVLKKMEGLCKETGVEDEAMLRNHLNSARELLQFVDRPREDELFNIRTEHRDWLEKYAGKAAADQDSKIFRFLLAARHQPGRQPTSPPTLRRRQDIVWAPVAAGMLRYYVKHHRDDAKLLGLEIDLRLRSSDSAVVDEAIKSRHQPRSTTKKQSATLRRIRSLSETYWRDVNAVASDTTGSQAGEAKHHYLSDGLYIRRSIQDRVLKKINQLAEVSSPARAPLLIKGEAGHGKSCLMWALYDELMTENHINPVLLNAVWFMPVSYGRTAVNRDDVSSISAEIGESGRKPVILIDTADLLLHHEIDIAELVALCKELEHQQAIVVLTCRPEEAGVLDSLSPVSFELKLYDDRELVEAIEKYSGAFCPSAEPREQSERIRKFAEPEARGLPVREVLRSPLLLRLLFELNAKPDTLPEVREVDVSRIYGDYWDRRVVTDKRIERKTARTKDLSVIVGYIATILLAIGRTEVERDDVVEKLKQILQHQHVAAINDDIDELLQRSVLKSRSGRLVFFHQTMFEYAAAKGLLARFGSNAVHALLPKLLAQPEDLFVGAVLEQLLIIMGRSPLAGETFTSALQKLIATNHDSLHSIALGAAAHHPALSTPVTTLLETSKEETARRYALIAPSVADVDLSEVLEKLETVWMRERCRTAVLDSLERLAAREPDLIMSAVRSWQCVPIVLLNPKERIELPGLPRLLGFCAHTDPRFARDSLLALFHDMATDNEAPEQSSDQDVSASGDSEPEKTVGRGYQLLILETCLQYRTELVTTEFVQDLTARFDELLSENRRSAHEMQVALGRIWEYHLLQAYNQCLSSSTHEMKSCGDTCWINFVKSVVDKVSSKEFDPVANAHLVGVGRVLATLSFGHWAIGTTFSQLASMSTQTGPFSLSRGIFPELLHLNSPATNELEKLLVEKLNGLPASKNRPELGGPLWAAVARQTLRNAALSPPRLAHLLNAVPTGREPATWLSADGLAWLLVPAALGGHSVAEAALTSLLDNGGTVDPDACELILDPVETVITDYPQVTNVLVELSVSQTSTSPLNDVLQKYGANILNELEHRSDKLWALAQHLLSTDSGKNHRDGASLWTMLEKLRLAPAPRLVDVQAQLLHVTDYRARGSILAICASLARRNQMPLAPVRDLLQDTFAIDGDPPTVRAVVKARNYPGKAPKGLSTQARDFAIRGRDGLVKLMCLVGPLDEGSLTHYSRLATALPASSDVVGSLGHIVIRLVAAGMALEAAQYLLDVIGMVPTMLNAQDPAKPPLSEDNLGNRLRPAMRELFKSRQKDAYGLLLESVPSMPETHARMVVATAASEAYQATYETLSEVLAVGEGLPRDVAKQIISDRRNQSRSVSQIRLEAILDPDYSPNQRGKTERNRQAVDDS